MLALDFSYPLSLPQIVFIMKTFRTIQRIKRFHHRPHIFTTELHQVSILLRLGVCSPAHFFCLSLGFIAGNRHHDQSNSYKNNIPLGLAYRFRSSVHYRHGRKHGSMQADMVLEELSFTP